MDNLPLDIPATKMSEVQSVIIGLYFDRVFGCIVDKSYWLNLIILSEKPSLLPVCDL